MDDTASTANETAAAFDRLDISARQAGASMLSAFGAASAEGRKLEDSGRLASSLLTGGLSSALTGIASGASGGFGAAAEGVSSTLSAGGGAVNALSVTMNISTPDAESFRQGEAQVSAALARAVARGSRAM
jgi:hypothetical protein